MQFFTLMKNHLEFQHFLFRRNINKSIKIYNKLKNKMTMKEYFLDHEYYQNVPNNQLFFQILKKIPPNYHLIKQQFIAYCKPS